MLNIKKLQLSYGKNILIDNASVQLYKNQIVGLIGQNGSGKSSLFKLFLGELHPEAGDFSINKDMLISHVEQEIKLQDVLLVDYVLNVHPLIINDSVELPEYYSLKPKAEKLLINLGFELSDLTKELRHFSGGWQMRANLAKALFVPSDILLLDEPTNHLDIETVLWLEDWLKLYKGLAIVISHDREFLDNITTHTLHLSGKNLNLYSGNYSTFERTRYSLIMDQQQSQIKMEKKRDDLQSFINRFSAGTRAKQAQSRAKMLEKLTISEAIPKDIKFSIKFLTPDINFDKLLSIHDASIGYDTVLIKNVKFDIFQDSKIGILGKNGVGKSTLIKALIDSSTLIDGNIELNNKIKIGYFAQNTVDHLDPNDTPLEFITRECKSKKEQEIRSFLGGYGFIGDKVKEKIGTFSGGEKARLTIAGIIINKPNILFLDEPTNHLDMQMREELARGIQDFQGAVVIISHDKFMLQSIANEFYLIYNNQLELFNGNLDDYHKFLLNKNIEEIKTSKEVKVNKNIVSNKLKVKSDIMKIEEKIKILNKEISTLNLENSKDLERHKLATGRISKLEDEWLILTSTLEGLK